jgi:hypothetical protein
MDSGEPVDYPGKREDTLEQSTKGARIVPETARRHLPRFARS